MTCATSVSVSNPYATRLIGAALNRGRLAIIEYAPAQAQYELDCPSGGRGRLVTGIRRSARFNEKNMGLLLRDRSVLHALGHYEYFAWTNPNRAVAQLNSHMPGEDQKQIVGIFVFVPNEFALDLHDHEVMSVEAPDDARLPIF
jgi:hypothetical protein